MNELETLYDAVKAKFVEVLPAGVMVDWQPDLNDGFNLPAVFFAMTGWVPGTDPGTGQTVVNGTFQAVVLVDPNLEKAGAQVAWLALMLTQALRYQNWGLDFVHATENVKGGPADSPAFEGFEVCGVDWTQQIIIGDIAAWPFPEIAPTPVVTVAGLNDVDVALAAP